MYLVVPAVQKDLNLAVKKLYVGNLVGKEIVLEPDSKNSYTDVFIRQGESNITVDEFNEVVSQPEIEKPIDPGTEDARKEETEPSASEPVTNNAESDVEQLPEGADSDEDPEGEDPNNQPPAFEQLGEREEVGEEE